MGSLPRLQCQQYTARSAKDQSNNNPLRSGRGLGAPSPQRERLTTPARPGASVPALHAQCLLPMSTDGQDRTPPQRRRGRAAIHQDAGKPLCERVQRRGYTPARAQAPPAGAQRRALALTPSRLWRCLAQRKHSTQKDWCRPSGPALGSGPTPAGEAAQCGAESRSQAGAGDEIILAVGEEQDAMSACSRCCS
jgi:hypothetical protein